MAKKVTAYIHHKTDSHTSALACGIVTVAFNTNNMRTNNKTNFGLINRGLSLS